MNFHFFILLSFSVILYSSAEDEVKIKPEKLNTGLFTAVDFSQLATVSQFQCLLQNQIPTAFVRVYTPTGSGSVDVNGISNVKNGASVGVGMNVYMSPQPLSTKTPSQQFDEMVQGLNSYQITLRNIWIQVSRSVDWPASTSTNIVFINSLLARARQYNLIIGIFTNINDWQAITGGWNGAGTDVSLWYWNSLGPGTIGEAPANFADFKPFGQWNSPSVKQYAQYETICSITANKDVFLGTYQEKALNTVDMKM